METDENDEVEVVAEIGKIRMVELLPADIVSKDVLVEVEVVVAFETAPPLKDTNNVTPTTASTRETTDIILLL